jgi:hypothetical protein
MDGLDKDVAEFFEAEGKRVGLTSVAGSRRVIIYALPPRIAIGSVLEAVSAIGNTENGIPGGIVSAHLFEDPTCQLREKIRCAMIEFLHPSAAQHYVNKVNESEIYFQTDERLFHRNEFRLKAYLANSPSNLLRPDIVYLVLAEQTRSLTITVCPEEYVWEILRTVGTHLITKVEYHSSSASLHLEFVSMVEADRAYGLLRSGFYPQFACCELVPPQFSADSTQRNFDSIPQLIVSSGRHQPTTFNRAPFNAFSQLHPKSWTPFYRPSTAHLICARNGIMPYELMEWLESRRDFKLEHFRVMGSEITITRKSYNWALDPESHIKLLLYTSLHDPTLSEAWDDYFRLRGLPNLRRYEAYRASAAGDSTSDESEADVDTDDNAMVISETEDWSEESLMGTTSVTNDAPIHSTKEPQNRSMTSSVVNTVSTPSRGEVVLRSTQTKAAKTFTFSWIIPEPITKRPQVHGSADDVLIPGLGTSESRSWDLADYEDWICSPERASISLGGSDAGYASDCDVDLIAFDNEAL